MKTLKQIRAHRRNVRLAMVALAAWLCVVSFSLTAVTVLVNRGIPLPEIAALG